MESDSHREAADAAEREADAMQRASDRLGADIGEVRQDCERKREDPAVPGAEPPDEDGPEDADED